MDFNKIPSIHKENNINLNKDERLILFILVENAIMIN
jgi:hypothetical protein